MEIGYIQLEDLGDLNQILSHLVIELTQMYRRRVLCFGEFVL